MGRYQSPMGEFARRGFDSASGAARVWERWTDRLGGEPPVDLALFEPVADRDLALDSLERLEAASPEVFREMASDEAWLRRLLLVMGGSSVLAHTLVRNPAEARILAVEPVHRGLSGWRAFFNARIHLDDGVAAGSADQLRLANRAALIEIAARDLSAPQPDALVHEIAAELSHVADVVLDMSLAFARAEVPGWRRARVAVLAMGKTGAQELNYISDVDVIYVAEPAEGATADEAVAVAGKLAAAQARICSSHTNEGSIWQLDAALRPEGKAGPLVRTLASYRAYYAKWAKNWEFQAMLKARPAAGDLSLGQEFVDAVWPLVWQAGERPEFLPEVRAMRERVISLIPAKQEDREIKLGSGGLRDTEFSVQLLQLVHGRADERIRTRGTFDGLMALIGNGYIGRADGAEMARAYRFQRVLEHRIQLRRLRRTHLMPDDELALSHVARSMGSSAEDLQKRWRDSARRVRQLQQRLFFSPLLDVVSQVRTDELQLSTEAAKTRMRALGFADPQAGLGHIRALTIGRDRGTEIQRQLLPAMLQWFADGPNPDFGLLAFRQLSESLGKTSWYLRALRDEGYMAQRLARVASSSRYVVDLLKRAPEHIKMLASTDDLRPRSVEELTAALTRAANRYDDLEQSVASVRALRRAELCRIALSDVLGHADLAAVGGALSDLASATVEAGLQLARRTIDAPPVGVIALGRWGGYEVSYSSDADCMFVVPDGTEGEELARATDLVRRAAEIIGKPGPDPALVIDTDLRPEGKGGPQVRTVSSYLTYYTKWASTWEAQMLLRARHGAGERALSEEVLAGIDWFRYPEAGLSRAQISEIRKLKSRMENERIPRGVPRDRHLKLGPGGLSDVEWTVQLLQLQHGHEHAVLRTTSTMDALAALAELEIVPESQAARLQEAWHRASMLRDAIMLVRGRASDALPSDTRELAAIALLLGYRAGEASRLVEDTRRLLRRAADAVDAIFWAA
ncbi:bifunctional [glutamine synthetase] adenylyltransferase/[glutamine synthetase]-adenylyl-L-tyrosine phosphorylase [Tessaracoccus sp. ZS01]|uniref:bifunctional [glutamine synthetase] adenylyltransferase/[glutamine synthetase]-adenylyl-L-tyrosine phosphorylase n=1 Tax=Tessaracoccus sp. ZS01 TaxID=1906324 RepID=UPI00096F798A|nr:bifunctional [glutamine synthetase] adenylyltransferase/[glutamine synthetase]-adenylyl-L-tyrosine phosphorylase [Tessaracoccus sp. ZS01]MCG6566073.1 bifunctional glutamine-synthetase adenylyltransferase/deadenyltransferase [Tessaracoccus sp. ZS01]OMG58580.1 bifunctional glutamine-synthetase adenylyltransferase/deadenyltransferase [Tessaracoccus sp. ZS01]